MDTIKTETFTLTLTYEMSVNIDTGEILGTKLIKRAVSNSDLKPTKEVKELKDDGDPKLYLEDNKYRLSNSAVLLMGLNEDSKLIIKYENRGSESIPIIGTNVAFKVSSGNKLTKSNTVSCRGNNNDALKRHGTEFKVVKHPTKEGLFVLESLDKPNLEKGDENISSPEDCPFDLSIDDLIDKKDENITEIDSTFFKL